MKTTMQMNAIRSEDMRVLDLCEMVGDRYIPASATCDLYAHSAVSDAEKIHARNGSRGILDI